MNKNNISNSQRKCKNRQEVLMMDMRTKLAGGLNKLIIILSNIQGNAKLILPLNRIKFHLKLWMQAILDSLNRS